MPKEIDFSNPNEEVALVVNISGGGHFCAKTTLSLAYETLAHWKKYVLFASEQDPVARSKMETPYVLYHFMGPNEKPLSSILFQTVLAMQIVAIPEDSESWKGGSH